MIRFHEPEMCWAAVYSSREPEAESIETVSISLGPFGFESYLGFIDNPYPAKYNARLTRVFQSVAAKNVGLKRLLAINYLEIEKTPSGQE